MWEGPRGKGTRFTTVMCAWLTSCWFSGCCLLPTHALQDLALAPKNLEGSGNSPAQARSSPHQEKDAGDHEGEVPGAQLG